MKKVFLVAGFWMLVAGLSAQTVTQQLQKAFAKFESDSQLKHAISSLYVIDAATGKVVFDKNSQIGLAGASTQKIITAATAFELLGKDYRYETSIGYEGNIEKGDLDGDLIIIASGDPTFGSWRWKRTSDEKIIDSFVNAVKGLGIKNVKGSLKIFDESWETQEAPDRWIVQDIGNYYGAGASALNWKENQFDIILKSGSKIGDPVEFRGVIFRKPGTYFSINFKSEVKSAAKGSGDNAYIYNDGIHNNLPAFVIRGTIPVNEDRFVISASLQNPGRQFRHELSDTIVNAGISFKNLYSKEKILLEHVSFEYTHYSPSLDSIIYWFLKKSVNLYGEALIKTFAYEKSHFGSTDSGINIVKKFWKEKGLDDDELNIYDGSGLSPMNRITTHAQVEILKYAKTKDWFTYFYDALPEYNAMKMKSGTIGDVKGFCGYHKSKDGKEYIFSFLVNNYSGRSSSLVAKMYKVLDELK